MRHERRGRAPDPTELSFKPAHFVRGCAGSKKHQALILYPLITVFCRETKLYHIEQHYPFSLATLHSGRIWDRFCDSRAQASAECYDKWPRKS